MLLKAIILLFFKMTACALDEPMSMPAVIIFSVIFVP
jgi:hypothetical protein